MVASLSGRAQRLARLLLPVAVAWGTVAGHGAATPAAASTTCVHLKPAHSISGWLHTKGTQIADTKCHQVRLLSITFNGLGQGNGLPYDLQTQNDGWLPVPSAAFPDLDTWGFNAARVDVSWANLEPTAPTTGPGGTLVHHWNTAYLQALDDAIAGFRSEGIAVVLQMYQARWSPAFHDLKTDVGTQARGWGMPSWLYPAGGKISQMVQAEKDFFIRKQHQGGFITAWKFVVARYAKDQTVVGVDILNESYDLMNGDFPHTSNLDASDLHLAEFFERVAKAIRSVNPHLLLIFEEHQSPASKKFSLARKPKIANGVYADHFYAANWVPNGRDRLRTSYLRAHGWNFPMWVGEFTAFNRSVNLTPYPGWAAKTKQMLAYCKDHDIGWAIWLYGEGGFQQPDDIHTPKPQLLALIRGGF